MGHFPQTTVPTLNSTRRAPPAGPGNGCSVGSKRRAARDLFDLGSVPSPGGFVRDMRVGGAYPAHWRVQVVEAVLAAHDATSEAKPQVRWSSDTPAGARACD